MIIKLTIEQIIERTIETVHQSSRHSSGCLRELEIDKFEKSEQSG